MKDSSGLQSNPWVSRFLVVPSRDGIRRKTTRRAQKRLELRELPPDAARLVLEKELKDIYIPSDQCCEIMQQLWGLALAHALTEYPSIDAFLDRLDPAVRQVKPHVVALIGPAGLGKTELISALQRLMPADSQVSVSPDYSNFLLRSMQNIVVGPNSSIGQMLSPVAAQGVRSGKDIFASAAQQQFLGGVCLNAGDELQFVSASDSACTKITGLCIQLSLLGPPLVLAFNFSLVHKLQRRKQEERDRILPNPIVMLPDAPEDQSWKDRLEEYRRIDPKIFCFDPERDALRINLMTFGLGRAKRDLICLAYWMQRKAGGVVNIEALTSAYNSPGFAEHRRDVEYLKAIARGAEPAGRRRPDLECPIDLPGGDLLKQAMAARAEKEAQMAMQKFMSTRTVDERREIASEVKKSRVAAPKHPNAKKRKPVTAASLLDGFQKFKSQQKPA